jgi:hypothetical protein
VKLRSELLFIVAVPAAVAALLLWHPPVRQPSCSLRTYEDGSFELYEHGQRIGTGCLDEGLCGEHSESPITVYSEP